MPFNTSLVSSILASDNYCVKKEGEGVTFVVVVVVVVGCTLIKGCPPCYL